MFRSLFMGLWFFGLVAGAGAPVLAEDSPTAVVERLHATLLDNMKNGKALGFEGRRAKLDHRHRAQAFHRRAHSEHILPYL